MTVYLCSCDPGRFIRESIMNNPVAIVEGHSDC